MQRSWQRSVSWVLGLLLLALCGCARTPERLYQKIVDAEKRAHAAQLRGDPEGAHLAADTAQRILADLQSLVNASKPPSPADLRLLESARAAADSGRTAGLAKTGSA